MKRSSFKVYRLFEEILLYSGQFGLFYIVMQFIIQNSGFWGNLGHLVLLAAILVQAVVLSATADNLFFRTVFSFIVPLSYSLIELTEGLSNLTNAAHVGFWVYAIVSVALMALKKRKSETVQYLVEFSFVLVNILIYLFLYFYFDTLKDVGEASKLTVFRIFDYWGKFLQDPTHWYVISGGGILALTI